MYFRKPYFPLKCPEPPYVSLSVLHGVHLQLDRGADTYVECIFSKKEALKPTWSAYPTGTRC
jgi:hypothetical protein